MDNTMPNTGRQHQGQHASRHAPPPPPPPPPSSGGGSGGQPPAWLGFVRGAVKIMSVLIVVGLGLLVYGFWRESREIVEQQPAPLGVSGAFEYPADMRFYQIATTADGGMVLVFENTGSDGEGSFVAITLDASGNEIARLTINRTAE